MRPTDENAANLIVRLFSYTPRVGRISLEDFCTEAFAWCLTACPAASIRWMDVLRGRLKNREQWEKIRKYSGELSVATQEPCDRTDEDDLAARFDMVIRPRHAADFMIVIESKIGPVATLEEQVAEYRRKLDYHYEKIPERCVIALTAGRHHIKHADAELSWADVAACLKECESSSQRARFDEFVGFLRLKGLIPMDLPPLLPQVMQGFSAAAQFLVAMKACFGEIDSYDALRESFPRTADRIPVIEWNHHTAWYSIYAPLGSIAALFVRPNGSGAAFAGLFAEVVLDGDRREIVKQFTPTVIAAYNSAREQFPQMDNANVLEGKTHFRFITSWPDSGKTAEEVLQWFDHVFTVLRDLADKSPSNVEPPR